MRIAFVTLEYPPFIIGGAGLYASRLVEEMANTGNDIVVFTPRIAGGDVVEKKGRLTVFRIPISQALPLKSLQFSLRLPRAFSRENRRRPFDVVHFNSICYWFLKRSLSGAPAIATLHHMLYDARNGNNAGISTLLLKLSDENNIFQQLLEKRTIESVGHFIVDSRYTGSRLESLYRVSPEKIHVIYCGLNFNVKEDLLAGENKELDSIGEKRVILFVGRVNDPRKGLDVLMKALKLVAMEHDAILVVVGSGDPDGAKAMAKSLEVEDRVIFTGFVDTGTLKRLYLACDVYAIPSKLEGFGLTVPEAMAAGKPIVATRVGAIPEIMENGVHGVLVNPGDAVGMARAICVYLGDEKLARETGTRNMSYAIKKFSWALTAAKTIQAYGRLSDEYHDDQAEPGQ